MQVFQLGTYLPSKDFDVGKKSSKQNTKVVWPVYIDTRICDLQTVSTYGTDSEILILCVQDFAQSFRQSNYHHLVVVN